MTNKLHQKIYWATREKKQKRFTRCCVILEALPFCYKVRKSSRVCWDFVRLYRVTRIALWNGKNIFFSRMQNWFQPTFMWLNIQKKLFFIQILYGEFTTILVDREIREGTSTRTNILSVFGGGRVLTNATMKQSYDETMKDSRAFGFGCFCGALIQLIFCALSIGEQTFMIF